MPLDPVASRRRRRIAGLREAGLAYKLVLPAFAFLLIMIVVPACSVVWNSIAVPQANGRRVVGLHLYQSLLSDPINRHDIIFTLLITVTTVGLLLPLCYALALYLRFARGPLVGGYQFLCIIPLFVPTIISAFAFITFFQNQGVLDSLLRVLGIEQARHLTYNEPINDRASVVQMLETLVFMIWIPTTAFQNVPRDVEEAARDAGATPLGAFLRVTLPLAAPAIGVAMLLSFVSALDEAQGTLIVGLPDIRTMPLLMYDVINSYPLPVGGVFSVVLSIPSLIVLVVAQRVLTRRGLVPGAAA